MFFLLTKLIKAFHATNFFLNPLKATENQRFSDIFRGPRKKPVTYIEASVETPVESFLNPCHWFLSKPPENIRKPLAF